MDLNKNLEIASFLESFESIVAISSMRKIELSTDDIYYILYCKAKAQQFITEAKNNKEFNTTDMAGYISSLESIITQILTIEKVLNTALKTGSKAIKITNKCKIDNTKFEYEHSVRQHGNLIYSVPFISNFRSIDTIYGFIGYSLTLASVILGIFKSDWNSTVNVLHTFGVLSILTTGILGALSKTAESYTGKFILTRSYTDKQKFISNILTKIIIQTNKNEYMHLVSKLKSKKIDSHNTIKVFNTFAKIESLGEYINKYQNQEQENFVNMKYIENQFIELSNTMKEW